MTDTVTDLMKSSIQGSRILQLMKKYDMQIELVDVLFADEKTTQGESLVALAGVFARRICLIAKHNNVSRNDLLNSCLEQVIKFAKGVPAT
jgi:hypothetical protein